MLSTIFKKKSSFKDDDNDNDNNDNDNNHDDDDVKVRRALPWHKRAASKKRRRMRILAHLPSSPR